MILDEGILRIRDLIYADMDYGKAGTDGTLPTEADTGLIAGEADTNVTLEKQKSGLKISMTHILTSGIGNATLQEWEIRGNSNTDSYNRAVKASLTKTSVDEVTMIHTFNIAVIQ